MSKQAPISALILARDEAAIIANCIKSLAFVDEIVLGLDQRTADDTLDVVKKSIKPNMHLKVVKSDLSHGFASAKNALFSAARNDWCLIIDADEVVQEHLAAELIGVLDGQSSGFVAYAIDFDTSLLGKRMKHGGWEETHTRFVLRNKCKYTSKEIHEVLSIHGATGKLQGRMTHNTHRTIADILRKIDMYSTAEAHEILKNQTKLIAGHKILAQSAKQFVSRYILRAGWRDGIEGLIEAALQSYSVFVIWAKAWEIQKREKESAHA